jgi:hypothetical protein
MNFQTVKIRASAIGQLMTGARAKDEIFGQTAKSLLIEIYLAHKYGRWYDISSKYLEKGTRVEEDSFDLFTLATKKMYVKNEENIQNEYVTGTPDIIKDDTVIDIKSSWDLRTFWNAKMSPLDKGYEWQLQTYMMLTGAQRAQLVYVCVDTPADIIEREKRNMAYKWGVNADNYNAETEAKLNQVERLYKFDDIPVADRVHIIDVERDETKINQIPERVMQAREWMNENFN